MRCDRCAGLLVNLCLIGFVVGVPLAFLPVGLAAAGADFLGVPTPTRKRR